MEELKYYNLEEASKILKCSTATLRRRIKDKSLKVSKIGHGYIVEKEELQKFLKMRQV